MARWRRRWAWATEQMWHTANEKHDLQGERRAGTTKHVGRALQLDLYRIGAIPSSQKRECHPGHQRAASEEPSSPGSCKHATFPTSPMDHRLRWPAGVSDNRCRCTFCHPSSPSRSSPLVPLESLAIQQIPRRPLQRRSVEGMLFLITCRGAGSCTWPSRGTSTPLAPRAIDPSMPSAAQLRINGLSSLKKCYNHTSYLRTSNHRVLNFPNT